MVELPPTYLNFAAAALGSLLILIADAVRSTTRSGKAFSAFRFSTPYIVVRLMFTLMAGTIGVMLSPSDIALAFFIGASIPIILNTME